MSEPSNPPPGVQIDPQAVIDRLVRALATAQLQAAQFGALADQLLAERNAEETTSEPPGSSPGGS